VGPTGAEKGFGYAARRLVNPAAEPIPSPGTGHRQDVSKTVPTQGQNLQGFSPLEDALIGTVLDNRIQLLEVLGQGGMSVVYKAKQLNMDRLVAVKTLHIHLQDNPHSKGRFQREINSLCKLNHPNIITMYDCVFGEHGQPFVIMDYLKGRNLEYILNMEGAFPPQRAYKIILQICDALAHAHRNGIIHRDLKPSNIMFLDDYEDLIKVVDFGLAKMAEENVSVTRTGQVEGTPTYMSPEQWRGETPDHRTDIYSLGAVMYETLTGTEVFMGRAAHELLHKHLNERPRPFREANPEGSVPDKLERVVMKCLEKEPDDRYQSMTELKTALQKVFGEGPAAPPSRFNLNEIGLGAAAVALVIGLSIFGLAFYKKLNNAKPEQTAPIFTPTDRVPASQTPPVPPPAHKTIAPASTAHSTTAEPEKGKHINQPVEHKAEVVHHHHKVPRPEEHQAAKPKHEAVKPGHTPSGNPWDKLRNDLQEH
jgi:serine/threonine protein kinase